LNAERIAVGVVVLAAGASTRMGRPKLLLPWGGTTVLGHVTGQWRLLNAVQIVPVFRSGDLTLEEEWVRLGNVLESRISNAQAEAGMFSSVQAASKWGGWRSEISHFVITLGDQPQVSRETLGSLVQFASRCRSSVIQPQVNGRAKHPVVLRRDIFLSLGSSSAATFRDFLEQHPTDRRFMDSDDSGLEFDLDTPEDYANLRQRFDSAGAEIL
jgi:molybdenum cofactor cytidylyltransferase